MGYDQGLAVGLAVGIPCFVVLVGGTVLFLRRRRHDQREDAQTALDFELRDNNSYTAFHEALHTPFEAKTPLPEKPNALLSELPHLSQRPKTAAKTVSATVEVVDIPPDARSDPASAPSSDPPCGLLPDLPEHLASTLSDKPKPPVHTRSAYAFYDQFIPIVDDVNLAQPPPVLDGHSVHSGRSGRSTPSSDPSRLLDTLAKQLQAPFFDKLPPVAQSRR